MNRRTHKNFPALVIVAAGAALRFYFALSTSYFPDEEVWIIIAESISVQPENLHLPIRSQDQLGVHHPALPAYFIRAGSGLVGDSVIGYRMFSLLASALTLVVSYRLALACFGLKVARWATLLLAFNEYHIAISVLAIEKGFQFLFVTLSMYFYLRFLQTQSPKYLVTAAVTAALATLCNLVSVLLVPICFLTLLLPEFRPWWRRRELYGTLACLIVLIIPIPFTLSSQPFEHLSRIGGIGLNFQPLLFYGVRTLYEFSGYYFADPAGEYPSMNPLSGAILLGGAILATSAWLRGSLRRVPNRFTRLDSAKENPGLKFLSIFFFVVVGFFGVVIPGSPRGMDPVVWFWSDISLLAAVPLAGWCLSTVERGRRRIGYAVAFVAATYATVGVFTFPLRMSRVFGDPRANSISRDMSSVLEQGIGDGSERFDHQVWDELVQKYAADDGRHFDYAGLKTEEATFQAYLDALAKVELGTLSSNEIKTLFINAYNAYTIKTILDHVSDDGRYQIESIREVRDVFGREDHNVGGFELSLDNMEHAILRPIFKDPRVHFAVNYAATSCFPLPVRAFDGERIDAQLDEATRKSLSNLDYISIENDKLLITKIMKFYGGDFVNPEFAGSEESLPAYIAKYATENVRGWIAAQGDDAKVEFRDFDWKLNKP